MTPRTILAIVFDWLSDAANDDERPYCHNCGMLDQPLIENLCNLCFEARTPHGSF
jgi:hypothetical protein